MGYSPDAYRHNLDQRAFEMLNSFPKFVKLCEAYNANFSEIIAKISSCVSIAVSIKGVLDTQILTDDGLLTDESQNRVVDTEEFINKVVRLENKA